MTVIEKRKLCAIGSPNCMQSGSAGALGLTAASPAATPPTEGDIYTCIFTALLSRRLQPGMRLGEDELATAFGVSRTKIRSALARLAQDGVVELRRNQGASVAQPSEELTRHVFALRSLVEPSVARDLAGQRGRGSLAALRRHLRLENDARKAGRDADLVRLTGAFHLMLAEKAGMPRHAFLDFLNKSVMGSMFTAYKAPALSNLDFHVTFTPQLLLKDIDLGLSSGRTFGVPMPTTSAARDQVQTLIGHGYDQDFSQLLLLQAKASGLELKSEHVNVGDGL